MCGNLWCLGEGRADRTRSHYRQIGRPRFYRIPFSGLNARCKGFTPNELTALCMASQALHWSYLCRCYLYVQMLHQEWGLTQEGSAVTSVTYKKGVKNMEPGLGPCLYELLQAISAKIYYQGYLQPYPDLIATLLIPSYGSFKFFTVLFSSSLQHSLIYVVQLEGSMRAVSARSCLFPHFIAEFSKRSASEETHLFLLSISLSTKLLKLLFKTSLWVNRCVPK